MNDYAHQAIVTKYHGPTDTRGARISATTASGIRMYISFPYELSHEKAHRLAAVALSDKLGWSHQLLCGALKDGYVFIQTDC